MKLRATVPFTALLVVLLCALGFAQSRSNATASSASNAAPEFDHLALTVHDLQKSADFYERVMLLKSIPEPFHDGKHLWYRIGAHQQLHVIASATAITHDIAVHLGFHVASVDAFRTHLDQMQVKYRTFRPTDPGPTSVRPDGVKQIYFQDPDVYWIEVNEQIAL